MTMEVHLGDILQWIGSGSILTLAIAMLRAIQTFRDSIRDLRKDLGIIEPNPTGLAARVFLLESEYKNIRTWAVRQGYDERS